MKRVESKTLIYYLSLIGFFAIFSTTISKNPVLSLFSNALGANDAIIGLIAALSPLAGILLSFPIGFISDKLGRKKILVISGFIFMSAPLLYLLVQNPWFLIPIRFFHGVATALLGPVASAIIADKYSKTKGEKLGIYSSSTLIGRTLAPILGGAIISYLIFYPGLFQYKAVYMAAFLIGLPVFILTLFYKENKFVKQKITGKDFKKSFSAFINHSAMRSTALIEMATYFAFGAFETYLPLFLQMKGYTAYHAGIIFALQTLSIALSKPLFGKLSDKFDKRIQITLGISVLGISFILLPFFSNLIALIIISLIFGLGMSTSTAATSAYVAEISNKKELGASMGALSSTMDIGHSLGPLIVGSIITISSYTIGFASAFALIVITALLFYRATFKKR